MQNITLSADERLISAARARAQSERSTLNEQFRRWLEQYAGRSHRAERARRTLEEVRKQVRSGGRRFTREELNER